MRAATVLDSNGFLDVVAFFVIILSSFRNRTPISTLLRAIVRDATVYFIAIFTSHIVITFFFVFARVSIILYTGRTSVTLTSMLRGVEKYQADPFYVSEYAV